MIEKILVPLDGSKLAEKALSYAGTLAQKFEADIILVRVIQPMPTMSSCTNTAGYWSGIGSMAFDNSLFYEQFDTDLADMYLSGVQRKLHKLNLAVRTTIAEGYPEAETIVELARREVADLIVMSTHGRSGIGHWVHGSVAEHVLRCAPCPIFLVRAVEPES